MSLIRHNHHLSAYSASYSWAVNVMWRHDWDVRACLRSAQMWMSLTRCSFVLFVLHRVFVVLPNNCVHTNSQKSLSSSALCPPNMCMDMFSINESSKYLHVFIIAVIWIFIKLCFYINLILLQKRNWFVLRNNKLKVHLWFIFTSYLYLPLGQK